MSHENVVPLEHIRRYRVQVSQRQVARGLHRTSKFLLEASTIAAVVGRGLQYISRELGYAEPRRIKFPLD